MLHPTPRGREGRRESGRERGKERGRERSLRSATTNIPAAAAAAAESFASDLSLPDVREDDKLRGDDKSNEES